MHVQSLESTYIAHSASRRREREVGNLGVVWGGVGSHVFSRTSTCVWYCVLELPHCGLKFPVETDAFAKTLSGSVKARRETAEILVWGATSNNLENLGMASGAYSILVSLEKTSSLGG